jgi:hypothetical protein
MLLATFPARYQPWEEASLRRELLEQVIKAAFQAGDNEVAGLTLPEHFRGTKVLDVGSTSAEQWNTSMNGYLDCLTGIMERDYLTEPAPGDWLLQARGPILNLARERAEAHRRHRQMAGFGSASESIDDADLPLALREFKENQFSPAELSLQWLRRLDKRWKVEWTSLMSRHLVVREGKTIYVYWPSTTVEREFR